MLANKGKDSTPGGHGEDISGVPPDVPLIDWPSAMEQCSGDLGFLAELLIDLWDESNGHARRLRPAVAEGNNIEVQHEAHSIKGAAANLMCHRLRIAALTLEKTGLAGERGPQAGPERDAILKRMKDDLEVVEKEMLAYENFLKNNKLL